MPQRTFSVIIPIYNSAPYLKNAIDSVISQDIGFLDNIELLLVDDGSTDASRLICQRYLNRYPDNIRHIVFPTNHGANHARNYGLKSATGCYISFLDADDKLGKTTLRKVFDFFSIHENEIDCVACRIKYLDDPERHPFLNYAYKETRVVDILEDPTHIQVVAPNIIFKRDILTNLSFDESSKYLETLTLTTAAILQKKKYGVISDAPYMYRVKKKEPSLFQNRFLDKEFYFRALDTIYRTITLAIDKDGRPLRYLQNIAMYDLSIRLKQDPRKILTEEEHLEYLQSVKRILELIDDSIILEQRNLYTEFKLFALRLKHDEFDTNISYDNGYIYFKGIPIFSLKKNGIVRVESIRIDNDTITIEGRYGIPFPKDSYNIFFQDNNGKIYNATENRYQQTIYALGVPCFVRDGFSISLKVNDTLQLSAYISYGDYEEKIRMHFARWARINSDFNNSYYKKDSLAVYTQNKSLVIENGVPRSKYEKKYLIELIRKKHSFVALLRLLFTVVLSFKKREIWVFADNLDGENDNAEVLMNWVVDNTEEKRDYYFVLRKKVRDIQKYTKKCKVLRYGTIKHKLIFSMADKFICSRTDPYIYSIGKYKRFFKDHKPTFYYLQHGVLEKDFTRGLHKFKNNFRMFVTSGIPERDNMLLLPYGWNEDEIVLTGLARHDSIFRNMNAECAESNEKHIVIAPTWRKNLGIRINNRFIYNREFKASQFYKFYNSLINDERLLATMEAYGYTGLFRMHTVLKANTRDFKTNQYITIDKREGDYASQFNKSCKLLITDYSSIAFDYAYAYIPTVYTQFDKDVFYGNHSYDAGYFDYGRDGFGPVCYDYESTISTIINAIENDCVMDDSYTARRDAFFAYSDDNNSKRIYESIIKL